MILNNFRCRVRPPENDTVWVVHQILEHASRLCILAELPWTRLDKICNRPACWCGWFSRRNICVWSSAPRYCPRRLSENRLFQGTKAQNLTIKRDLLRGQSCLRAYARKKVPDELLLPLCGPVSPSLSLRSYQFSWFWTYHAIEHCLGDFLDVVNSTYEGKLSASFPFSSDSKSSKSTVFDLTKDRLYNDLTLFVDFSGFWRLHFFVHLLTLLPALPRCIETAV